MSTYPKNETTGNISLW